MAFMYVDRQTNSVTCLRYMSAWTIYDYKHNAILLYFNYKHKFI